jgi:hypothetical protein
MAVQLAAAAAGHGSGGTSCSPVFVMFGMQAGPARGEPEGGERRGMPYQHVDLREYDNIKTNMTDEELVLIPTKDLNKVVKESGMLIPNVTHV